MAVHRYTWFLLEPILSYFVNASLVINGDHQNSGTNLLQSTSNERSSVFAFLSMQGVTGGNITIKVLCGIMGDTSLGEPYARYAAVARLMMETFSMKCLDVSFNTYLRDMTNTSWEGPAAGGGGYEHNCGRWLSVCVIKVFVQFVFRLSDGMFFFQRDVSLKFSTVSH